MQDNMRFRMHSASVVQIFTHNMEQVRVQMFTQLGANAGRLRRKHNQTTIKQAADCIFHTTLSTVRYGTTRTCKKVWRTARRLKIAEGEQLISCSYYVQQ